eukprot:952238_1
MEMFKQQESVDQQIDNVESDDESDDDFDDVFLPSKQSLPPQLERMLDRQMLDNPYFMHHLHCSPTLTNVYWCSNDSCKTELFYSDTKDKTCPKCNSAIDDVTLQNLQTQMTQYQTRMRDLNASINNAIHSAVATVLSASIIQLIQEFVPFKDVQYHKIDFDHDFDLNEYSIQKEGQRFSRYVGDKTALQSELNKCKYNLQFGDVVTIDAYGPHFIGLNEQNEPRVIINPCYNGHDRMRSLTTLCVPLEITESDKMNDFFNFYRLNCINLFKAKGCEKIRCFPVSMAAVSHTKLTELNGVLSLPDDIFSFPQDAIFYLESRNFSYIDTLHVSVDGELLISLCIDEKQSELYELGQQMLSLVLRKLMLQSVLRDSSSNNAQRAAERRIFKRFKSF